MRVMAGGAFNFRAFTRVIQARFIGIRTAVPVGVEILHFADNRTSGFLEVNAWHKRNRELDTYRMFIA